MRGTNLHFIKIKNAANIVLHSNINKGACSLSFLRFNLENVKRVEVSCLF